MIAQKKNKYVKNTKNKNTHLKLIGFSFVFIFASCGGGYLSKTKGAHSDFYSGKYIDAAQKLEKPAHIEGKDQLLYLLDRATSLFYGGDLVESNKEFLEADKKAEISDYTSISTEAATLLTSDEIKHYKGEEFEYVLISQYLAMGYLLQGKYEDALVECRRVNHKLHMLVSQGGRKYKQNPMALYLSAMIYETEKKYDDAYIDYKHVAELIPAFPYLKEDLVRLAVASRNREDISNIKKQFKLNSEDVQKILKNAVLPEVVFLISSGQAPEKRPDPSWNSIPRFYSRSNGWNFMNVTVSKENEGQIDAYSSELLRSHSLYDVEQIAMQNLEEKWGPLIAKKIAGIIAKDVVADQIGKRTDPLIGAILWMGLHASDTADTRSWRTLPHDFQVLRIRLPGPGNYSFKWGQGEKSVIVAPETKRVFLSVKI